MRRKRMNGWLSIKKRTQVKLGKKSRSPSTTISKVNAWLLIPLWIALLEAKTACIISIVACQEMRAVKMSRTKRGRDPGTMSWRTSQRTRHRRERRERKQQLLRPSQLRQKCHCKLVRRLGRREKWHRKPVRSLAKRERWHQQWSHHNLRAARLSISTQ